MRKYHIRPLPFWVLTDLQPAFYDSESGTVLQQMSRVYAKVQELLDAYNQFVKEVNTYITEFENGIIEDFESFKNCIITTMNNYIESVDIKLGLQDKEISDSIAEQNAIIEEAINYMKNNIIATTTNVINQAIEDGMLNIGINYNPQTEGLNIVVTREGE